MSSADRELADISLAASAEPALAKSGAGKFRVVLVGTIILLTLAYYFWTTVCSFDAVPAVLLKDHRETDHHNLLARGFLNGHTHLDGEIPLALLNAPNPYDPKSRGPVEVLHDASFYRGKYYIYFGPAPAVTLFLPFTVLTGRDLPLPYGVLIFASGAYLVLVSIFLFLQRRHFPHASGWSIAAGLIALGAGSLSVALLRRPHIWEISGASGLFYFAVSMLCLVRALHSPLAATRWAGIGGLALGLAVASRPTYIVCSILFALPLLLRPRGPGRGNFYGWRPLFAAAIGCATIVLGLLAYNYTRFENPFEFGQKYQLSSIIEGDARHFSVSYVAWNFRIYFLSALQWTTTFPFHNGIAVPPLPAGHGGYEYSFGLFTNLPFSLFGIASIMMLFRRFETANASLLRATLAVFTGAALLPAVLLLFYFGSCIRYMADFAPWFMLLATCGVLGIESNLRSRLARGLLVASAVALALFSATVAGLGVVNFYDVAPGAPPSAYDRVARWLNYPTFLSRLWQWPDYRPREVTLSFPDDGTPRQEILVGVTRANQVHAQLLVDYIEKNRLRFGYREPLAGKTHFSPVIASASGRPHTLHVSLGTSFRGYDGRMFRLRLHFDGWPLWDAPVVSFDAFPGELQWGGSDRERFTGQIHAARPIRDRDFPPARLGGARLRIKLSPEMAGRSFPLVSSGRRTAGDLLFLRVDQDGRAAIGYDHWADPLRFSPPIPTTFGGEHVFEFWIPPANTTAAPHGERELLVKVDGTVHWRLAAPWFPTSPKTIYIGQNPIGGTTCEPVLINGVIEETQIPFPSIEPMVKD